MRCRGSIQWQLEGGYQGAKDTLILGIHLQNCEELNTCCLHHRDYGILRWWPQQTHILYQSQSFEGPQKVTALVP